MSSAFDRSSINKLEIKNSNAFSGFNNLNTGEKVSVQSLVIDQCRNFLFDNGTIPAFDNLKYLAIKSCGLRKLPKKWNNFSYLESLVLSNNQISEMDLNNFEGVADRLLFLDLSNNSLANLDWKLFENFKKLSSLDLSFTSIASFNSFERYWPNANTLKTITLKGYENVLNNNSICAFNLDVQAKKLDLTSTFIELDRNNECSCFVFYIYREYRKNATNNINDWLLNNRVPLCYQTFFIEHLIFRKL